MDFDFYATETPMSIPDDHRKKCVFCRNKEQSDLFRECLDKIGLKWHTGKRYVDLDPYFVDPLSFYGNNGIFYYYEVGLSSDRLLEDATVIYFDDVKLKIEEWLNKPYEESKELNAYIDMFK